MKIPLGNGWLAELRKFYRSLYNSHLDDWMFHVGELIWRLPFTKGHLLLELLGMNLVHTVHVEHETVGNLYGI